MQDFITFLETLKNLSKIPRSGGILFAGIDVTDVDTVAEHSHLTIATTLLLTKLAIKNNIKIRKSEILEYVITHDWTELVLLDIPKSSPSYQSYFSEDIKKIIQDAEKKVNNQISEYLKNALNIELEEVNLTKIEYSIIKVSDIIALTLELLSWKYNGLQYEWLDYMWANQVKRLTDEINKAKFTFLNNLPKELDITYQYGKKRTHPFLTKKEYQNFN